MSTKANIYVCVCVCVCVCILYIYIYIYIYIWLHICLWKIQYMLVFLNPRYTLFYYEESYGKI